MRRKHFHLPYRVEIDGCCTNIFTGTVSASVNHVVQHSFGPCSSSWFSTLGQRIDDLCQIIKAVQLFRKKTVKGKNSESYDPSDSCALTYRVITVVSRE